MRCTANSRFLPSFLENSGRVWTTEGPDQRDHSPWGRLFDEPCARRWTTTTVRDTSPNAIQCLIVRNRNDSKTVWKTKKKKKKTYSEKKKQKIILSYRKNRYSSGSIRRMFLGDAWKNKKFTTYLLSSTVRFVSRVGRTGDDGDATFPKKRARPIARRHARIDDSNGSCWSYLLGCRCRRDKSYGTVGGRCVVCRRVSHCGRRRMDNDSGSFSRPS